jgi:tRNA-specific 2-thiouridylase
MSERRETVAVGLSGGVDSSVAAALLLDQGHDVLGLTMEVFGGEPGRFRGAHACYGPGEEDDVVLARALCHRWGIPYHTVDLRAEFKSHVLDYFSSEYLRGRTPNPCVRCNQAVKFGYLVQRARESGIAFDAFATGHYARIEYDAERQRHVLVRGADPRRDQTYFLARLESSLLPQLRFPLGALTKDEVRAIARDKGLLVAERRGSQDFIQGGDHSALFAGRDVSTGPIKDLEGRVVGTHKGIVHYTVGQRRGLGVAASEPLYVLRIDGEANSLIVGPKNRLLSPGLIATDVHYVSIDPPTGPLRAQVKIRHNHGAVDAQLEPLDDRQVRVTFDVPQLSVSPGQAAVFYDGDLVLGAGFIEQSL